MGVFVSLELFFSGAGLLIIPAWLTLIFSPQGGGWGRYVIGPVAIALSMLYVGLLGAFWSAADGGFQSLASVGMLFQTPGLLLAGWVHYLAFDLLVGYWERAEADRLGISRAMLAPCLLLTLFLGPVGWLCFLAVRHFHVRTKSVDANSTDSLRS